MAARRQEIWFVYLGPNGSQCDVTWMDVDGVKYATKNLGPKFAAHFVQVMSCPFGHWQETGARDQ